MSWHAEPALLHAYARGDVDAAGAFSVEAHVLECAECRMRAVELVDRERLARVWHEVENRIDTPRRAPAETLLVRSGVPDHLARVLGATPSLTLSWLAAVSICLALAVTAAHLGERGMLVFLALAPLLPVAGVAAAYGPGIDPTYEISVASAMRGPRLLLIRAAAVVATTTVLAGLAALALPQFGWLAAAWLLPSLALTVLGLALATYLPSLTAFGAVAFAWIAVASVSAAVVDEEIVLFEAAYQVVFFLVLVASALVVARRREAFDREGQE
jgi:hypothetical protein